VLLSLLAFAASAGGIVMGLTPLLQLRQMLARRSSADVSLPFMGSLLLGNALWLSYGAALHNPWMIAPNVVGVLTLFGTMSTAAWLRRTPGATT
jgi:uncharacterized protein with PQ loop repeat